MGVGQLYYSYFEKPNIVVANLDESQNTSLLHHIFLAFLYKFGNRGRNVMLENVNHNCYKRNYDETTTVRIIAKFFLQKIALRHLDKDIFTISLLLCDKLLMRINLTSAQIVYEAL